MNDFAGRVALVTGTTGIGRATALRLAAGGAQVLACGIEAAANTELAGDAGRLGLTLHAEACDVTDPDQVQAAVAKAASQFGGDSSLWNRIANRHGDVEPVHGGECGQHLFDGALRHPGDEEARRRSDCEFVLGARLCLPTRSGGLRCQQGGGA